MLPWNTFFDHSTIAGLHHFYESYVSRSRLARFGWITAYCLAFSMCMWSFGGSFQQYYSWKTATKVSDVPMQSVPFPAVTLFNMHPVKGSGVDMLLYVLASVYMARQPKDVMTNLKNVRLVDYKSAIVPIFLNLLFLFCMIEISSFMGPVARKFGIQEFLHLGEKIVYIFKSGTRC